MKSEGETTLFWSRSKAMKKMHQQIRGRWLESVTNGSTRAMSFPLYGGREFLQIRCADARNRGDRRRWGTRSTVAAKQLAKLVQRDHRAPEMQRGAAFD